MEEKEQHQKLIVGLILIVIVCTSQVGSAFTSKIAIQRLNAGPFFLMWIHTLMMIVMYPLGCLLIRMSTSTRCIWWCKNTYATATRNDGDYNSIEQHQNHNHNHNHNQNQNQNQHQRVNLVIMEQARPQKGRRMFYMIIILFYPLWIIANYCYVTALRYVSASTMVSIFGSCTAFVSLGERILLNKPCSIIRIIAVLLAVFGVIAYGFIMNGIGTGTGIATTTTTTTTYNSNNNSNIIGVLLGTLSSIAAATYKVAFKKFLGSPTTIDVCLFLSLLGIVNLIIGIVPVFILTITGIEEIPSFYNNNHDDESTQSTISATTTYQSWGIILGGSILILVFNSSIAFGIAITSHIYCYRISIIASFVLMTLDQYLVILGDGDTVGDVDDHDFATTTGITTTIGNHPNGSDEELRSMIIEYDQASLAYIVYIVDCAGHIPWDPIERSKDQHLYEARDTGTKHWVDSKDCPLDDGIEVISKTTIEFRIVNKIHNVFGSNTTTKFTEKDFMKSSIECIYFGSFR
ncbi:hypothetical protein FRACYDRAFT_258473 [Fragilariopsis cylindrus CCMP1102]|uniref:EamA domain-containing protein n=1 Tax=Fragilariopsis cylindrus CCMP1102 TaxID=635003 RepID=A0A1E7EIM0_9STRA|nr:hypothetical protein FRACYDRAFT_258473 [Fragilariopsis cylindrus CCMP1102]|eukprot:OEU05738.1 hypothetical protein FRACYDRAFT_258473 [Fragilariopsis cylindrus CCMP1102]